jgi:diamine N-acetyltransferase
MVNVQFRPTEAADLDYVLQAEHDPENSRYVFSWTRQQHLQALANPDVAHLIVQDQRPVGYILLGGRLDPNQTINLQRIVITDKGKGYGKASVERIKQLVFETYNAHRLWLDVKTHNDRARALYRSAGFVEEGLLRECLKSGSEYESLIVMSILKPEYQPETRA